MVVSAVSFGNIRIEREKMHYAGNLCVNVRGKLAKGMEKECKQNFWFVCDVYEIPSDDMNEVNRELFS